MVSLIDPLVYLMGEWGPLLHPLCVSDLEFPFKSYIIVCRSSSPCACDSSLIDFSSSSQNLHHHMEYGQLSFPFGTVNPPRSCHFLDVELPSNEAILEAMTKDYIPWEDLHRGLCFLPF